MNKYSVRHLILARYQTKTIAQAIVACARELSAGTVTVSVPTLNSVLYGNRFLNIRVVGKLAKLLKVDFDDLHCLILPTALEIYLYARGGNNDSTD